MKHLLLTTIAAVVLVGCGRSELLLWKFSKEFYAAVENNDKEAVKKAVADSRMRPHSMENALRYAADKGQKEIVKILIAGGADVNSSSIYGLTPSMFAASNGHKEITKLLITKGADLNATTRYSGRTFDDGVETTWATGPQEKATVLDQALANQHTEIANLLRKHGGKTGEELKAAGK